MTSLSYVLGCDSRHNAESEHHVNNVDAILFIAKGRSPLVTGMLVGITENFYSPTAARPFGIEAEMLSLSINDRIVFPVRNI